jgi:small subunit ribosomal protein S6
MNRKYEIGFILNPELNEEEEKKVLNVVLDEVKKNKGTVENIDEWGKRNLAYPIKKHQEGIYYFLLTDMDSERIKKVETRLRLTEKVMRHIMVRLDEQETKANRLKKHWKRREKFQRPAGEAEKETEKFREAANQEGESNEK